MKNLFSKGMMFVVGVLAALSLSATAGQSPLGVNNAINTSGYYAPENLDVQGNVRVNGDGWYSSLNISASGVVKATSGGIVRVVIESAPSAAGAIYDSATLVGATTATKVIPLNTTNTAGTIIYLNWPLFNGLVVDPGANGVVSVSYE